MIYVEFQKQRWIQLCGIVFLTEKRHSGSQLAGKTENSGIEYRY